MLFVKFVVGSLFSFLSEETKGDVLADSNHFSFVAPVTEHEVVQPAERFLLCLGLEDEEDGVFAVEFFYCREVDTEYCIRLRHVSTQFKGSQQLSALRRPRAVGHDVDVAVNAFWGETDEQLR